MRNRAVGYGVCAAAVRGGGRLTADRVLRFRIGRLSLAAFLILLRILLLLVLVSAVAGCGTIAAEHSAISAAVEKRQAKNSDGERSREHARV